MDPILAEIRLNRIEEERQHQFNQHNVQNNIPIIKDKYSKERKTGKIMYFSIS